MGSVVVTSVVTDVSVVIDHVNVKSVLEAVVSMAVGYDSVREAVLAAE